MTHREILPLVLTVAAGCGRIDALFHDARTEGPVPPDSPLSIAQVASGDEHACLRTKGGEVWCWGELTYEDAHPRPERIDLGGAATFIAAAEGGEVCAVMDGTIACVADGKRKVIAGIDDAVTFALAESGFGGCAVRRGGTVTCWRGRDVKAVAGVDGVTAMAFGQGPFATRGTGAMLAWGYATTVFGMPRSEAPIELPFVDVVALAAGGWHVCAIDTSEELRCVGENHGGQLGDGTTETSRTPITPRGLGKARHVAAHFTRTIVVDTAGQVYWWGKTRVADDGPGAPSVPERVAGIDDAVEGTTGTEFACARTELGYVKCWGRNEYGQLGDGSTVDREDAKPIVWPVE